jgi:two-component system sensor histidine kinase/response regulator
MKINELVAEYFNGEHNKEQHASRLLTLLMEYWATEKDYELKNQLLKGLVLKYAAAERDLVELNAKLVELNQLKNRFLGFAAHDLRNPLISIRGLSEMLLCEAAGALGDEQKELLATINTASSEMLTLVNDLLDISVIESGKIELRIKHGSLVKLVQERIRINKILAEKKRIRLHEDFDEMPYVPFDANRIGQVIDNLIGNAVKFSPPDSNIFISVCQEGTMARVSVRDAGPGLAKEEQTLAFGEFQKLKVLPTGGEKGTGLGLAIAKRIVEAHRGIVQVESQQGAGAIFSFFIPMEEGDGTDS